MAIDQLFERLAADLELAGIADAEELVSRWFATGQAVPGLPPPSPPDVVEEVEAAGPPDAALYTRSAELQSLWLVIAGARAEYDQAEAAGDSEMQAGLLRALSILVAVSEEENAAVTAALKAQSN